MTSKSGGSNTRETAYVYVSDGIGGEVFAFGLDQGGGLSARGRVKLDGPGMCMTASPDRRFLYAQFGGQGHSVATLAIDPSGGGLEPLASAPLPDGMVYMSVDRSGRFLFAASYSGHLVSVHPIGPEGFVQTEPVSLLRPGRHAHSIRVDPSNRFAYVPCLGNDYVRQFRFDEKTGILTDNSPAIACAEPGSGPRHFAFSPDGRFVYMLNEMSGDVTTYAADRNTGALLAQGSASAIPPDAAMDRGEANYYAPEKIAERAANPALNAGNPKIWCADIHITPDGRFAYVSERACSTIARFAVDAATGKLTYLGSIATEKQPRYFKIDPRGKFLVAAGEKSDHIAVYAIDCECGGLAPRGRYPAAKGPAWVEIVAAG